MIGGSGGFGGGGMNNNQGSGFRIGGGDSWGSKPQERVPFAPLATQQSTGGGMFYEKPPPFGGMSDFGPSLNNTGAFNPNEVMGAMNNSSPTSIVYTKFEDLPNYDSNVNLNDVAEAIKNNFEDRANWKSQFDAIDNLRILNKFYPEEINQILENYWKYIVDSLESAKSSNIVKNALIFVKEIFGFTCRSVRVADDGIQGLIPMVLAKCFSDKSFIKLEAQNCVNEFLNNCIGDISIVTLCQCCFDKNQNICELSMQALTRMVDSLNDNVSKLSNDTITVLMKTLSRVIDGKRSSMQKAAQQICVVITQLFGPDNFLNVMSQTLTQEEGNTMMRILDPKQRDKPSFRESNVHEFIAERRREKKMPNMYDNNNNFL